MSFYLKYELSRLLHSDGAKTFQAIDKASRQNVLLHLVDKAGSPELVEKVKRLQADGGSDFVEVGEFAGSYYVVTRPIEDFEGLGRWLDLRGSDSDTRPEVEAPTASPGKPETVTRPSSGVRDAAPPTSPTIVDSPARPLPDASAAPGEFTRLFGDASPAKPPPPAPKPEPRREPAPPQPVGTQPVSAPRPAAADSGEFTQLFGESREEKPTPETRPPAASVPPSPPPSPAAPLVTPAAPVASSAPTAGQGGEFTRLFGDSSPAKAPPRDPPPAAKADDFAAMFGAPREPTTGAHPVAEAPPTRGAPVEKTSGEFTQLFGDPPGEQAPRLKPASPQQTGNIEKSSGEFTRLFGPDGKGSSAPKKPKDAPSKPPPFALPDAPLGSSAGAPGEFTRMFGGGSSGSTGARDSFGAQRPAGPRPSPAGFGEGLVGDISGDEALSPDQGPRVSKSSKPFQEPGEFTRMFGSSDGSRKQTQDFVPAAQRGTEGYASGLFRNPSAEPRTPQSSPAPSPGGGQAPAVPGAYTQMFEGGGAPPAAAQHPAAAMPAGTPVEAVKSGPSRGMLIALIAAVLIAGLSLGAAVYLFLNRDSGEPPSEKPAVIEQPAEPAKN